MRLLMKKGCLRIRVGGFQAPQTWARMDTGIFGFRLAREMSIMFGWPHFSARTRGLFKAQYELLRP